MSYKMGLAALALASLTASAHAAGLGDPSLKDPVPDSLTWHGVTVYGVIDLDYA